jgi:hypothetical protein
MAVNLGSSNISAVKLGATDVSKIYLGSDVVFGGQLESLYSYRMTTSDYLSISNYSGIDFSTSGEYTFHSLVKFSSVAGTQVVFANVDASLVNGFLFAYISSANAWGFQWRGASVSNRRQFNFSGTIPTTDVWYSLVLVIRNLNLRDIEVYINGVAQTKSILTQASVPNITGKNIDVGAYGSAGSAYIEADYNSFTIWNTIFESSEIPTFYNGGQPILDFKNENKILETLFDYDIWDASNSRFNVVNNYGTNGISVNAVKADKVISSPY